MSSVVMPSSKQLHAFVNQFKVVECECCDEAIGFRHKQTGSYICMKGCYEKLACPRPISPPSSPLTYPIPSILCASAPKFPFPPKAESEGRLATSSTLREERVESAQFRPSTAPVNKPEGPNQVPAAVVPVNKPETPTQAPIPVKKPETPKHAPIPVNKPETPPKQAPIPVNKPETPPKQAPIPVNKPETPKQTPLPVNKPETPKQASVPVNKPETPKQASVPVNKPETPKQASVPVNQPEATEKVARTSESTTDSKKLEVEHRHLFTNMKYSENLLEPDAKVRVQFAYSTVAYIIVADADETALKRLQGKIKRHALTAEGMKRAPIVNEVVIGSYDGEYYRGRVSKVHGDRSLVYFIDFGDKKIINNHELIPITDELMKIPSYGMDIVLKLPKLSPDPATIKASGAVELMIFNEAYILDLSNKKYPKVAPGEVEFYEVRLWDEEKENTLNEKITSMFTNRSD